MGVDTGKGTGAETLLVNVIRLRPAPESADVLNGELSLPADGREIEPTPVSPRQAMALSGRRGGCVLEGGRGR